METYIEEEVKRRIGGGEVSTSDLTGVVDELESLLQPFSKNKHDDREKQTEELINLLEEFGSKSTLSGDNDLDNSSLKDFFSIRGQRDSSEKVDFYIDKLDSLQSTPEVATMDVNTPKSGISHALELLKKYKAKISR